MCKLETTYRFERVVTQGATISLQTSYGQKQTDHTNKRNA